MPHTSTLSMSLIRGILRDEAITRGLGDIEARMLVEWLVEQAERLATHSAGPSLEGGVSRLCRRARALARFLTLWACPRTRGAAYQLAGAERFPWPLPRPDCEPDDVLCEILHYEETES